VEETEKKSLLGLVKNKEYTFIKVKELPSTAMTFERTLFNGIFATGDQVKLSALKDVFYKTMYKAKKELEKEVDKSAYYTKGSRGLGCWFIFLSVGLIAFGIFSIISGYENLWRGIAFVASGIIVIIFGALMTKKTQKGNELYAKLAGFKEFLKLVEKDRLREFLKQDENYFDKVLPYAIVFDIADKWKDKLEGLDIPPPRWYSGNYTTFSTLAFMNSLDNSMQQMSTTFYSSPSSSGSSGGSFSGGGGFSGGGFGGEEGVVGDDRHKCLTDYTDEHI
jgi:uncharacterized membrane protein